MAFVYGRICVAIVLASLSNAVGAQQPAGDVGYPRKPIIIVVPFTPGNIDVLGRFYTQEISRTTNWSFVYDFKPGAAGTIGTGIVARAPADGYTLVGNTSSVAIAHLMVTKPYDWRKDLTPIFQMNRTTSLLMVSSLLPVHSVGEYIAYAKANPGKINWGLAGFGGVVQISSELLHAQMGVKVTFVPFKGYAQIAPAMASGDVQATLASYLTFKPQIDAGKIRPLALSLKNARLKQLPELKSLAEEGLPEFEHVVWVGIFAPSATPPSIASRLNAEFNKAAKSDDVRKRLEGMGEGIGGGTLEEFRQLMITTTDKFTKVVTDNNIQLGAPD